MLRYLCSVLSCRRQGKSVNLILNYPHQRRDLALMQQSYWLCRPHLLCCYTILEPSFRLLLHQNILSLSAGASTPRPNDFGPMDDMQKAMSLPMRPLSPFSLPYEAVRYMMQRILLDVKRLIMPGARPPVVVPGYRTGSSGRHHYTYYVY